MHRLEYSTSHRHMWRQAVPNTMSTIKVDQLREGHASRVPSQLHNLNVYYYLKELQAS